MMMLAMGHADVTSDGAAAPAYVSQVAAARLLAECTMISCSTSSGIKAMLLLLLAMQLLSQALARSCKCWFSVAAHMAVTAAAQHPL
jgi:hypothetical protein